MNLTFADYRSRSLKILSTKFDMDYVCKQPGFSIWRFDDICANHWKLGVEVFECVLALELYLVSELMVYPMKCEQCDKSMAKEDYIRSICNECYKI